jgi:O-antigen/teichoic acid export membrane protein
MSKRRTLGAIVGRGAGLVSTFLLNYVIARLLLPADFGDFQLLLTLLLPMSWIATAGLYAAAVRVLGEVQAQQGTAAAVGTARQLLRVAAVSTLAMTPVLGSLLVIGARVGFPVPNDLGVLGAFTVAIGLIALQQVVAEVFNGLHEVRITAFFTGGMMAGPITTLLFLVALVAWSAGTWETDSQQAAYTVSFVGTSLPLRHPSLMETTTLLAVSLGVTLPISGLWLRRTLSRLTADAMDTTWPTLPLAPLMRLGLSLLGLQLTVYLATLADVWIAGKYFKDLGGSGVLEFDWYIAARRITMLGLVPLQLAGTLVSPAAATLYFAGKREELQHRLRRYALYGALPSLAGCAALLIAPRWFISLYLGPRFVESASVVQILAVGIAIAALSGQGGYALAVTGHQRLAFVVNAASGAVVVLGGYPAVQWGGIEGLAMVSLIAVLIKYLGEWWLARRLLGVWTHIG